MNRLVPVLLIAAAIVFGYAPFLIRDSPAEDTMGVVFKIFYFHVSSALTMMLSAIVCAVASAAYLRRRSRTADHLALAAAELAVVFGAIVLITGPLWARKSWGFWWVWDARVTSTLVMWMMFSSYLLLRKYAGVGSETLSAAVGVFAGVMSPLVYKSVDIWRTQHPTTNVLPSLPPGMRGVWLWCLVGFLMLYVALMALRTRLAASQAALDDLHLALED
ncbi:MAG TPA: cytochrome c biogenesis protein CcsA [Vicinamibacterales bacterium]|nr:cytochrome c biogenesis protein CcsA [Vicinamibacterales bacterium]